MKCKVKSEKLKVLGLFFPMFLMGENFDELVKFINNSNVVKIYEKNVEIKKEKLQKTEASNYGQIDISYGYQRLFKTPIMKTKAFVPAGSTFVLKDIEQKIGDKNNFLFEVKYSYPIFTGFLITNAIKAKKLKFIQEKLKLANLKNDLTLKVAKLYSNINALNANIKALKEAKNALLIAKDKAKALFKEGLINKSNVDEIKAKYYEIDAKISETISKRDSLLNTLSYLLNKEIKFIAGVNKVKLLPKNFENRPDVKILKKSLHLADVGVKIAKSKFYPQVAFQAGFKEEGNSLLVNKNDYRNIDNSYLALQVSYSINFKDKEDLNIAKLNKLKALIAYEDYLNKVKSEYKNDLLVLNALKKELLASIQEVEARKSYYEFINSKFNEGLADSVDLSDAISKLAEAKAKRDYVKSQIFFYTIKANIDGGN